MSLRICQEITLRPAISFSSFFSSRFNRGCSLSSRLFSPRFLSTPSSLVHGNRTITSSAPLASTVRTILSRSFSTHRNGFSVLLDRAKEPYLAFQKAPNIQKIRLLTLQCLVDEMDPQKTSLINTLDDSHLEATWNRAQTQLALTDEPLPPYIEEDSESTSKEQINVHKIHNRGFLALLINQNAPYIEQSLQTPEFKFWFLNPPSVPFTRVNENVGDRETLSRRRYIVEQLGPAITALQPLASANSQDQELMERLLSNSEEDAFSMYLMLLPYLNPDTIVHEIGTWNGQNLLNIAMYAHLKGRAVAGCIGTDINPVALNFAKSMAKGLGLDERYIKFKWAHGIMPLDINNLGIAHDTSVKIGIRFIPVLDRQSISLFFEQTQRILGKNDILGLSYAMAKGKLYESNLAKALKGEEGYYVQKFEEGTTIFKPLLPEINPETGILEDKLTVLNTYFSEKEFRSLIAHHGLMIIDHLVVGNDAENFRGVCLLKRTLPST